jgi:hypothetical protein
MMPRRSVILAVRIALLYNPRLSTRILDNSLRRFRNTIRFHTMTNAALHLHSSCHLCGLPFVILVGEILEDDAPDRKGEDENAYEAGYDAKFGSEVRHGAIGVVIGFGVQHHGAVAAVHPSLLI